ncbi:hypothetical protein SPRG_05048 [Saprolegnia parasitica CBS 223.65]|uniref:Activating signal cointegrator 1 complex subunit 3 n=1 Tax=Saprolegnia parasitica (strain CBS 223.65) TaxID=695850 RepID=A0A067CU71_SAPPC|nr:hypothetical protein SPRG_05048 [Saprolegnia parasitica CBS 223.65]KDO30337.1 hypothetical protein SPRG_05048 [Saprolegnia parasitica CBS 223.65]|eukprot:XP_012198947.1 hypothetical protein SPRG_05048 [Saprolegnia parasitica CBS 223.65]
MGFALELVEHAFGAIGSASPLKQAAGVNLPRGPKMSSPFAFPLIHSFHAATDRPAFLAHPLGSAASVAATDAAAPPPAAPSVSPEWLLRVCEQHAALTQSVFSGLELANSVVDALKTDDAESTVFNLLGFDGFDLIQEILSNQSSIVAMTSSQLSRAHAIAHGVVGAGGKTKGASMSIQSETDQAVARHARKEARRNARRNPRNDEAHDEADWLEAAGYDMDVVNALRESQQGQARSPTSQLKEQFGDLSYDTSAMASGLPSNAIKTVAKGYEKVFIPPLIARPTSKDELVPISAMDDFAVGVFEGITHLNRLQSKLFEAAYHSNQNLLVCAPTGAGKTNVAMMTILKEFKNQRLYNGGDIGSMKIIYVAPMKALAQEVVTRFSKRLKCLKLRVAELTGDMQMTKQEIEDTHLIVTTPEKWDVITRKTHEQALISQVRLLIIDEVHLLADERGPVIETIVARTLRRVESSQTMIRIVGLSATLPNYKDVAEFLRVPHPKDKPSGGGLFHFDASYRPVPLAQTFIGITDKGRSKQMAAMNQLAYEYALENLEHGQQVMIFVHSRKETVGTIRAVLEIAARAGTLDLFCPGTPVKEATAHALSGLVLKSRNRELQEFVGHACGIHHAGMLRSDRNLTEQLFENGQLRVLCCTATLAWGVNLPAHAVLIKGTQIYNAEKGCMTPLSMLDVMQIFGRAGRPQYDTSGEATIVTTHDQLDHYLRLLVHQAPIESALIKTLPDHLNAEIVSGTVANMAEALVWLSYTYLNVRMLQSPMTYGMSYDERANDPMLVNKRTSLLQEAAKTLESCRMIRFDQSRGEFALTNLGRVASHYYITHATIETFNDMLMSDMDEQTVLNVICSSTEFEQVKVRDDELVELDKIKKACKIPIKGENTSSGKANILLQAYISNMSHKLSSFTLISDTNYVAQNGSRVTRALFEICLKKGWPLAAERVLNIAKSIDMRFWSTQSQLRRFGAERYGNDMDTVSTLTIADIGPLVNGPRVAEKVLQHVRYLPYLDVDVSAQPVTDGVLRLTVKLGCDFEWADLYHGKVESWWVWVEDEAAIYHAEHVLIHKAQYLSGEVISLVFHIPLFAQSVNSYMLRVLSDRWVGVDSHHDIDVPTPKTTSAPSLFYTPLQSLHPLPIAALNEPAFETCYPYPFFNPIQTQVFHTLYHTDGNVLLGAPTGSGKTIVAELAMLRVWKQAQGSPLVVYVAPLKALARERVKDWTHKFAPLGKKVVELTGDTTVEASVLKRASIIVTTPEKWDVVTRQLTRTSFVQHVRLVLLDEIHLLGEDRGPVLEAIVSRMRMLRPSIRLVGLSTALANAIDVGAWMGIDEPSAGIFNFRASVRPIPMDVHLQGFPGRHYVPRMTAMNKPTYAAIVTHSPKKPSLVFVASRAQTRLTAMALVSFAALDGTPKQFLHEDEEVMDAIVQQVRDPALKDALVFGIGLHHAGLSAKDRDVVEELFLNGKIQVVICTSTLAWGVNLPAHLVVIKGTEFYDPKQGRYADFPMSDILQMMGRAGRPQFDTTGVAVVLVHEDKQNFIKRFIYEPMPVESSLHLSLENTLNAEVANGTIKTMGDAVTYLSWTFLFQRVQKNPAYYGLEEGQETSYFFQRLVTDMLAKLVANGCVQQRGKALSPTPLGKIASAQYLDYATVYHLHTALAALQISEKDDEDATMKALLAIIAGCAEFADTPLRPHEAKTNASLAAAVRFAKLEKHWKWDAHGAKMKTSILLQMHLGRLQAPSSECYNDLRVVLDNLPRISGAMVDIAALLGRVPLVHACVAMAQGLLFGKWPDRLGWLELPHLSAADVAHLPPIANAAEAVWPKRLSSDKVRELQAALQHVPHVDVRVTQQPSTKKDGVDVTVSVRVTNESLLPSVVSTRFVKPRPRLLYALLVDATDPAKLLGMVHLPYRRNATKTLTLRGAPERAINLQVVSNASAVVLVPSSS